MVVKMSFYDPQFLRFFGGYFLNIFSKKDGSLLIMQIFMK
jgi:hypothetical protein